MQYNRCGDIKAGIQQHRAKIASTASAESTGVSAATFQFASPRWNILPKIQRRGNFRDKVC